MNLNTYRKDIDGLRAIAVLAVIFFHFGFLPHGYLGVDVFFVISGYLITKILFNEVSSNTLSISKFYLRRIRRIIPLVLFINIVVLSIGVFVMLPDDLENLSQSVVATNLFSNNILQFVTTRNYWDVVNEYKPLMHTWSLGIEEQFYVVYPFVFLFFGIKRINWILPILVGLTIISLLLFLFPLETAAKFYLIPFRFFELAVGGIGVIVSKGKLYKSQYSILPILLLLLLFAIDLPNSLQLPLAVLATLCVLLLNNSLDRWAALVLENKLMVGLGLISYSLYMWHQVILSFVRYVFIRTFSPVDVILIITTIVILSIATYYCIERPFRNKNRINTKWTLSVLFIVFGLTTSIAFYIYSRAGVIRDVPELDITKSHIEKNMHSNYNSRIYDFDGEFSDSSRTHVLIVGNSFARDWANVLLESSFSEDIEISYLEKLNKTQATMRRIKNSDRIYFSAIGKKELNNLVLTYGMDSTKIWVVGTKNFGLNNGIYYNKNRDVNYCNQRTEMEPGYLSTNIMMKRELGSRYVDLIGMVLDENHTVPVFTEDCKFISQDCRHLTKSGATYFARIIEGDYRFTSLQR